MLGIKPGPSAKQARTLPITSLPLTGDQQDDKRIFVPQGGPQLQTEHGEGDHPANGGQGEQVAPAHHLSGGVMFE